MFAPLWYFLSFREYVILSIHKYQYTWESLYLLADLGMLINTIKFKIKSAFRNWKNVVCPTVTDRAVLALFYWNTVYWSIFKENSTLRTPIICPLFGWVHRVKFSRKNASPLIFIRITVNFKLSMNDIINWHSPQVLSSISGYFYCYSGK